MLGAMSFKSFRSKEKVFAQKYGTSRKKFSVGNNNKQKTKQTTITTTTTMIIIPLVPD